MLWVANQAIRSAVGLSFEIVKVLQQHHSCSKKSAEEAVLIADGSSGDGDKPRRRRLDGFLEVVWPGLRVQIDLRGEVHSSRGAVSSTASAVRASGSRSRYCRTC